MKKILSLALALMVGAAALYAATYSVKQTSTVGVSVVSNKQATLHSVTIGNLAGGAVTVKVFDSALGVTTNANLLKYTLAIPAAVTQTAGPRTIELDGYFSNGITVSTDGESNTLTASWHYAPQN